MYGEHSYRPLNPRLTTCSSASAIVYLRNRSKVGTAKPLKAPKKKVVEEDEDDKANKAKVERAHYHESASRDVF